MKIENVRIVNHDKTIENATITIENSKITNIEETKGKAKLIAVPGFIDTHMHGFVGYDFMDGGKETQEITKALGQHGTTTVFATAMTGKWEKVIESLKTLSTVKTEGTKIGGIHLEGPFIALKKKGAHDANYLLEPTIKNIQEIIDASNGMLRKITIAPEILTKEVAEILLKNNVAISLGHGAANAVETRQAIALGARSVTHLWNAMTSVENRNPGMVEVFLQEDLIYTELITDLVHVDEEAISLTVKTKTPNKIVIVSDAIRPAGMKDGKFKSGGLDIVKKGSTITLDGTDTIAGSASTIHSNFKNMIELGYNMNDVVRMSSYNAAHSLGLEGLGEIKVGAIGDIVVMDEELNIKTVYINGKETKG